MIFNEPPSVTIVQSGNIQQDTSVLDAYIKRDLESNKLLNNSNGNTFRKIDNIKELKDPLYLIQDPLIISTKASLEQESEPDLKNISFNLKKLNTQKDMSFTIKPTLTESKLVDKPGKGPSKEELLIAAQIKVPLKNSEYINLDVNKLINSLPELRGADAYLPDAPAEFDGFMWPAKGTLTSGFGPRWGRMHKGIDIAAPIGTPIMAAASGEVIYAGWNSGGYGNLVKIKHANGSVTLYAHNNRLLVSKGQFVNKGQQISEMGSTGRSTGPHLHFEIHPKDSGATNPISLLSKT